MSTLQRKAIALALLGHLIIYTTCAPVARQGIGLKHMDR